MSSLVQSVKSLLEMLQLNCGVEQMPSATPERYLCLFASFYLTLSNPFVVLVTLLTLERSDGETRHFRRLLGGGATCLKISSTSQNQIHNGITAKTEKSSKLQENTNYDGNTL